MRRVPVWHKNERGVTLIELLAASAILALVITGICFWINATWDNVVATQNASSNQQQATTIISQLVQEIHTSQADTNGIAVAMVGNTLTISTDAGVVSYEQQGARIVYTTVAGHPLVLTENGTFQVQFSDQKTFTVTVKVGANTDPNQVTQSTTVTRYDWGQ
ncbi:MAG: prepilin-type N-terminal cleavage/methylation domain-containing protein [Tumebacillaceae bacterium]